MEIVDNRIADWKLTLPDTVADNASSGAVVLADWVAYNENLVLPQARAWLHPNGVGIDSGTGDAVMGDPAAAVAWLANALADYGTDLMIKILRSYAPLHAAATVGIDPDSDGLGRGSEIFYDSHTTSPGDLSDRRPRQLGWRSRPSDVRSL